MNKIRILYNILNEDINIADRTLVVWGTGNTSLLYYEGLKRLEREGFVVSFYTSSNIEKERPQELFNGKHVIAPDQIGSLDNPLVLIATPNKRYIDEICAKCNKLGVEARHIDEVLFKLHSNEIKDCIDLFDDDRSKEIYVEVALSRMSGTTPDPEIVIGRSLFNIPLFFASEKDGVYVDCGAFVGDSIESYIRDREDSYAFVNKIIAFEPDKKSYRALCTRVDRLKREWNFDDSIFELYNAGIGEKSMNGMVSEEDNGMSSKIIETGKGRQVNIYAIDDVVNEPYSFLKADIESYEYQMLCGARKSIQNWHPNLAICIYHNAVDFYQIPLLIHELYPDYRMIVRHHSFTVAETIVYAWKE